jgi:glutamate carboxypeptidase
MGDAAVNDQQLEAVVAWCRNRQAAMLTLLEELVLQNSFSGEPDGGVVVAGMLHRELSGVDGMEVRLLESERFAPHVVATSAASKSSAEGCVGLVGHHDTVFPPGTFEGFEVEDGIARGPGVLDMKGGLVIMVNALQALGHHGMLGATPVRAVIVSDEEVGSPEGGDIIEAELRGAGCALVFEAGREADAIITTRKGTGGVRAVATGRAAHAGNHHRDGANAIWALSNFVDRVQRLTDYDAGVTLNVGLFEGGQSRNTVPDHASLLIDLRFISSADGEAMVERVRAAAREAEAEVAGTKIELHGGVKRKPLERCDANVALYQRYAACAQAAGLGHGEAGLIGGGSDASTTAAIGIPSIDGLGPRGSGFHTTEELIEVETLVPRLEALVRFLLASA